MSFILTHTGKRFHYDNVEDFEYEIADIAHALANQGRFLGHTSRFYSVSEHSRLVANLLKHFGYSKEVQLNGLLHDLSEAFLGDMPTPLKQYAPLYKQLEERILYTAFKQLNIYAGQSPAVKIMDGYALAIEVVKLMPEESRPIEWIGATAEGNSWIDSHSLPDDISQVWHNLPWSDQAHEHRLFLNHYEALR